MPLAGVCGGSPCRRLEQRQGCGPGGSDCCTHRAPWGGGSWNGGRHGQSIPGHLAQGLHWGGGNWRQSRHEPGAPRVLWAGGTPESHVGPKWSRSGVSQCALCLCPLDSMAGTIVSADPGMLRCALCRGYPGPLRAGAPWWGSTVGWPEQKWAQARAIPGLSTQRACWQASCGCSGYRLS